MSLKCGECDSIETAVYATQGRHQYSAPERLTVPWSATVTAWPEPVHYFGPLCDEHAKAAGLWPSKFFGSLDTCPSEVQP